MADFVDFHLRRLAVRRGILHLWKGQRFFRFRVFASNAELLLPGFLKGYSMQRLYSVFDKKALTYSLPYTAVNDALAARFLVSTFEDTDNFIARYPEDFALYYVGDFDASNGQIVSCIPEFLSECSFLFHSDRSAFRPANDNNKPPKE